VFASQPTCLFLGLYTIKLLCFLHHTNGKSWIESINSIGYTSSGLSAGRPLEGFERATMGELKAGEYNYLLRASPEFARVG